MNDASSDPGHDASGHRARLRARLIAGDTEALLDHEIVEYLFMLAIPRVDTKPMARRLLKEFGSFAALMSADSESLKRAGATEAMIGALRIADVAALRLLHTRIEGARILSDWQALRDYLHADMAHRPIERVRVLHLNSKNMLIRDELVSEGSVDQAAVYVREVIRRALELGSTAIILVHNHPSGDPEPSRQDIAITRDIIAAGKPLGISVHDHIIVGTKGQKSLRGLGLI